VIHAELPRRRGECAAASKRHRIDEVAPIHL
jgi:hypothetical protein